MLCIIIIIRSKLFNDFNINTNKVVAKKILRNKIDNATNKERSRQDIDGYDALRDQHSKNEQRSLSVDKTNRDAFSQNLAKCHMSNV